MTRLTNIQQVISNIPSVEKVQQVQQHQAQAEQSRLAAQNQKAADNRSKKIENTVPSDRVDISVKEDQSGLKREGNKKNDKEDHPEDESADDKSHVDIRV